VWEREIGSGVGVALALRGGVVEVVCRHRRLEHAPPAQEPLRVRPHCPRELPRLVVHPDVEGGDPRCAKRLQPLRSRKLKRVDTSGSHVAADTLRSGAQSGSAGATPFARINPRDSS
jgi:hypothetical protein